MRIGSGHIFQNPLNKRSDLDLYQNEMHLADLAEGLGFDSIWGVEHHFTDYTLCPDVTQWLTWVAARTEKAEALLQEHAELKVQCVAQTHIAANAKKEASLHRAENQDLKSAVE